MKGFNYSKNRPPLNVRGMAPLAEFGLERFVPGLSEYDAAFRGDHPVGSDGQPLTHAERLENEYLARAKGTVDLMMSGQLSQRRLRSDPKVMWVYTAKRQSHLDPVVEAVMSAPDDVIAYNKADFSTPPEGVEPFSEKHTRWIAQQMLNHDYPEGGIQL